MSCPCTNSPSTVDRYDTTIQAGATFTRTLQWYVGSPAALVDISTAAARMKIRNTTTEISLSTEGGGITIDAAAQSVTFLLTESETGSMALGTWLYDIELVWDGYVKRILEGAFCVSENITV